MKYYSILLLILLFSAVPLSAAEIRTGEDVVRAMHDKYEGKWYKTLTFVQKNTQYGTDGSKRNSTWYEALSLPGKLRVDFAPLDGRSGMLFANGIQSVFEGGKLVRTRPRIHPLMVLGFDIYHQDVKKTLAQLTELKFDLSVFREDEWQGRQVYVIGAKTGDTRTAQFWIDRDNLYFVRSIRPSGPGQQQISETRFNKYRREGGGWISPEVEFIVDGRRVFLEEYSSIRTGVSLDANLFIPENWKEADTTYFRKH